ncbi:hypothetical protein N656DRAFT_766520 [Canariomyces notabilis]|uniref:Uncharacterized protein n=1 Tax=Canariomyces notabilis TaxID=2074819 RepID=A0AAN6TJV4_9PEZI|nr:hypothetical protein N656DRAFT_766520 [Canariomyces arenarius]
MAENKSENVARLASLSPLAKSSSDSDVSPGTRTPSAPTDYFSVKPDTRAKRDSYQRSNGRSPPSATASTDASTTTLASISEEGQVGSSQYSSNDSFDRAQVPSRKSSSASVTFRPPRNPSLPQGNPRRTDNRRLRESSPSPVSRLPHSDAVQHHIWKSPCDCGPRPCAVTQA